VRWAGEPDVLLKLEPTNKWLMNAVKIGDTPELTPDGLCLNSSLKSSLRERCALPCGSTEVVWPLADMVTVSPKVEGGIFGGQHASC